jgi:hypothetical protein
MAWGKIAKTDITNEIAFVHSLQTDLRPEAARA